MKMVASKCLWVDGGDKKDNWLKCTFVPPFSEIYSNVSLEVDANSFTDVLKS